MLDVSPPPFFSIVIPSYNRAYLIEETLESIQSQTFKSWECIVVDDGSTDNTAEVMRRLITNDSRIKYVYQENAERSAARNNGIKHSGGQYICFLDSDDRYLPQYLEHLYEFLKKRNFPEALVVTDFYIWDGSHSVTQQIPELKAEPAIWLFINPVTPSRACVHKNIFGTYSFREDITIVEDSVLWVSIANSFPVLQLKEPLVLYRQHEGNSVSPEKNSAEKRLAGLKKFFAEKASDKVPLHLKKELLSDCYYKIARFYASKHNLPYMLKNLAVSLYLSPGSRHTKTKFFMLVDYFPITRNLWRSIKK